MPTYDHNSQYDPGCSDFTRQNGCTWTSLSTGIAATTGGAHEPSPDYIHSLLPRSQETDPNSPGWSIPDAVHAASRYGMTLVNMSGKGWDAVLAQLANDHYVIVQGDSDQFGNGTCSGTFNGNHCIGIFPKTRIYGGYHQHWINDPICPEGRWEYDYVLERYAKKLSSTIWFAAFASRVPSAPAPTPPPSNTTGGKNVTIRYSGIVQTNSRMALKDGQVIYTHPGGSKLTSMSKAAAVPHVGLAGQVNGKAWRAVQVGTASGYSDGKVHKTVGYVPSSAGRIVPW
jgi:hypothetical protein